MQPPPAVLPAPPATGVGSAGSWRVLGVCAAFGLVANVAAGSPPGLAVALAVALAAVLIGVSGRASGHAWVLLVAAVVIGGLAAVRASTSLLLLDIVAATSLLAAGASFAHDGRLGSTTTRSFAARSWITPFEMVPQAATGLADPPRRLAASGPALRHGARTAIVVAPVVVVLITLFATADRAFASLVSIPALDPGSMVTDVIVTGLAAVALAVLLAATRSPSAVATQAGLGFRLPWVRVPERVVLLAAVDLVFVVFVAVQFTVFFGGAARVAEVDGLTYAEYARSGFWQLLGAAAIAGGVLAFAWLGGQRDASGRDRVVSAGLSILLVTSVLVVLASAFQRLRLYEHTYGYTPLRVLVHVSIVAVGVMLVCAAIAIASGRAVWLPSAAVAIAVAAVVALSAIDMEGFISRANLDRAAGGEPLDVRALAGLSPDAVVPAVDALPELPAAAADDVRSWLACEQRDLADVEGWAAGNLGRARARAALAGLDLGPCPAWFPS